MLVKNLNLSLVDQTGRTKLNKIELKPISNPPLKAPILNSSNLHKYKKIISRNKLVNNLPNVNNNMSNISINDNNRSTLLMSKGFGGGQIHIRNLNNSRIENPVNIHNFSYISHNNNDNDEKNNSYISNISQNISNNSNNSFIHFHKNNFVSYNNSLLKNRKKLIVENFQINSNSNISANISIGNNSLINNKEITKKPVKLISPSLKQYEKKDSTQSKQLEEKKKILTLKKIYKKPGEGNDFKKVFYHTKSKMQRDDDVKINNLFQKFEELSISKQGKEDVNLNNTADFSLLLENGNGNGRGSLVDFNKFTFKEKLTEKEFERETEGDGAGNFEEGEDNYNSFIEKLNLQTEIENLKREVEEIITNTETDTMKQTYKNDNFTFRKDNILINTKYISKTENNTNNNNKTQLKLKEHNPSVKTLYKRVEIPNKIERIDKKAHSDVGNKEGFKKLFVIKNKGSKNLPFKVINNKNIQNSSQTNSYSQSEKNIMNEKKSSLKQLQINMNDMNDMNDININHIKYDMNDIKYDMNDIKYDMKELREDMNFSNIYFRQQQIDTPMSSQAQTESNRLSMNESIRKNTISPKLMKKHPHIKDFFNF
jgi:hypothetical protein